MLISFPSTTKTMDAVDRAVEALGPLRATLVIVGGPILGRLLPPGTNIPKQEGIIEVVCRVEGSAFLNKLKAQGFERDPQSELARRWIKGDVAIDVVPSSFVMPGISNPWYPFALANAKKMELDGGILVEMIDASHYLAARLQWLRDWGMGEYRSTTILRDIVTLIASHPNLLSELSRAPREVQIFVQQCIGDLTRVRTFFEACENVQAFSFPGTKRQFETNIEAIKRSASLSRTL